MRNIVRDYVDKFIHERQAKVRLIRILVILGLVVTMAVFWELRYTGIALTNETNCGLEEHTHTEECYEDVLVCGQEESEAHVHSDACYETQYVLVCGQEESEGTQAVEGHTHTDACYETVTETHLICGQEESEGTPAVEGHTHTDSCYSEDGDLICGQEESESIPAVEGHTHTDACYETVTETYLVCGQEESESIPAVEGHTHTDDCYEQQTVLVCGLEEGDSAGGHTHTEDCYEEQLVCGKEEHTHTLACMSDDTADVETASVWESTLPDHLTGIWADDLILVARSQLGYTESTENYTVTESGDKKGYTRYGAWYGDPYGDWCAMFVSFCLNYSGIGTDLMPRNSGCYAWTVDLSNWGMYAGASNYTPKVGDIVFFDWTGDGRSNHVGIVEEVTYRTADGRTLSDEEAKNVYVDENGRTVIDVDTEVEVVVDLEVDPDEVIEEEPEEVTDAEAADEEIEIEYFEEDYAEDAGEEIAEDVDAEDVGEEVAVIDEKINDDYYADADDDIDDAVVEEDIEPEKVNVIETQAVEVYATSITTIEGNASNMVKEKSYDAGNGNILGYGILPQQPGVATAVEKDTSVEDADTAEADDTAYSIETDETAVDDTTESYDITEADIEDADIDEDEDLSEESSDTDMLSLMAATAATGDAFGLLLGNTPAVVYGSSGITPMQHGTTDEIHIDGISVSGTYPNVTFTIEFDVNTSVSGSTVYIELGEGIAPSENLINQTIIGYDLDGNQAFTFTFVKDDDGNWDIEIVFEEGYLDDVEDCWIRFKTALSGDGHEDETGENYEFEIGGETVVVPIPGSTEPEESESVLDVTKSSTEFDRDTNSFTYTVIVSSDTGTNGGISLDDKITVTGDVDFEISDVTIQKIGDNGGVLSEGQYTLTTDSDGNIHISGLPDLGAGEYYIIRYVVTVDADYNTQSNVKNTITGTTKDEGDIEVTDEGSTEKNINPVIVIQKSGVIGEDGKIHWTITINPNGVDINGFTLSDMLDGVDFDFSSGDYTITDGNGNTTNSGYAINGDGTIVFTPTEYEEVDGEQVGHNYNKYVIEYVTDAPTDLGSWSVTNEADLDKGDDHEIGSATVGDTNGSISKIVKSDDIERDEANGIIIIPWETTLVIPSGGIPDGAILADELEDNIWNHDFFGESNQWYTYDQICNLIDTYFANGITFSDGNGNTVTIDPSWFTIEVFDESISTGYDESRGWITYDPSTMDQDAHYTAWRITFKDGVNAAYADQFAISDEWTLVLDYTTTGDISAILSGEKETEEYANYTFIQSGEKKLEDTAEHIEHDSGGDVRKLGDDMQDGSSNITVDEDGNMSWTVEVYVGSDTSGAFTVTDYLPAGVTLESIFITDLNLHTNTGSLGENTFTLNSENDWSYTRNLSWANGQEGLTGLGDITVTATVTEGSDEKGQTVEVYLPEDLIKYLAAWYNTDGDYIMITFNVKIDEDIMAQYENGEIELQTFINSVEVTHNGSIYGTDSHEQNVEFEPADHSILSKSYEYNSNDPGIDQDGKQLSYQVVINPDAKTFLGEGETLTFTDTASIKTGSHYYEAYLTLDQTSVQFYYLYELTPVGTVDTDTGFGLYTYTDANGNVIYFEYGYSTYDDVVACESTTGVVTLYVKEATNDISWTYDNSGSHSYGEYETYNDYTITAEIPDGVAMMVEYTYTVHMDSSIDGYENAPINVTNSATLAGVGSTSSSTNNDDKYGYDEAAGGVLDYIIIHKVDATNYSIDLAGATFTLYYWSDDEQGWVYLDDFVTDEEGRISITASVLRELYPNYHNVGFKLIETEAPDGYILTDDEFYFYIAGDEDEYTPCWPDGFTDYAVELDNVYHWNIYADNVKIPTTEIEIEKLWVDEDGKTVSSGLPESITLDLYRYALKGNAVDDESGSIGSGSGEPTEAELVETITIVPDARGNWYHKVEDLPQYYIEDGYYWIYYYYFEESSVSGWTPDYGDVGYGDGVTEGTVTVTNTCSTEYELPKTGGMGTGRFTLIGLLMIIAAGAGVLLYRDNRRKRGCE